LFYAVEIQTGFELFPPGNPDVAAKTIFCENKTFGDIFGKGSPGDF